VIAYFLLVVSELLFYSFDLNPHFLIAKNCIPLLLIFSFVHTKNYSLNRNDKVLLASLILLSIGLNFSYFFYTKAFYLPIITITYFFEIQIQLYLILERLKRINTKDSKAFTKTFLIFSLSLFIIILFFPLFSFPLQLLFFVRVFQYACFISLVFGNKKLNAQISLSLWLIILSNISLLVDLVLFNYNFEYAIIMIMFYSSKFFFLNGYLKMDKEENIFLPFFTANEK
jgi:hypothetical protein